LIRAGVLARPGFSEFLFALCLSPGDRFPSLSASSFSRLAENCKKKRKKEK